MGKQQISNVVITGASAGLGRAIAHEFARHGCRVGLIARSQQSLAEVRQEVEALGGKGLILPLDVADAQAVQAAADKAAQEFGSIDAWVNNAMVSVFSPVHKMLPDDFKRVTEVTYLGFVYGTLAALKHMRARDEGILVQVGSALAYRSIPLQSAYCASKHAIKGFTESLRCELIHDQSNVKVSLVHMPALNTPQFDWVKSRLPRHPQPVPPIFQPEVGARAIFWAAHHAPREILVGYPTVQAVVGEKVIPGALDWYLAETCYDAQMTDEPVAADRPNNLYEPLPHLARTHGDFDNRAREFSPELMARTHLLTAGAIGLAAVSLALAGRALRKRAA